MNEVKGYLEYNGVICKIQSVEQLRDFMNGLGEKAKEMTEQERITCKSVWIMHRFL